MTSDISQLIERSVELELRIADLYVIFRDGFPQDSVFWGQLVTEERNHASMIGGARGAFLESGEFPAGLLAPTMNDLVRMIDRVNDSIKEYRKNLPSRQLALTTALEIEGSVGELHYQRAMEHPADSLFMEAFQELNKLDRDHAQRIRGYMNANGIQ